MRRYKANLNTLEIDSLAREIEKYKDSLAYKCQLFVTRLADEGITVARANIGGWSTISFSRSITPGTDGATGAMIGISPPILVQWLVGDGVESAWVAPLLMAEFGSGQHASDAAGQPNASWTGQVGTGRGTFPNQTHAFQDKWFWLDLDGNYHESEGEVPTMPIYKAATRMRARIKRIAWEVFHT